MTDEEKHPFGTPPENLPAWQPGPETRLSADGVRLEVINFARSRDRRRFLKMVEPIYRGDPNFIMPLMLERMHFLNPKNPALGNLDIHPVLAFKGGKCVGRITAHIDRAYDEYHGVKMGWFGFFESSDDPTVAHALLEDATRWVKAKGATEIVGPNNFTTNHQVGCLVENFSRPACVEMTYNPPYYERLFSTFGFGKAKDLHAYWIDVTKGLDNPKIKRFFKVSERVKKRFGISIRHVNLADFEAEVGRLFQIYNDSWQKNWGFVPVSEAEFKQIANDFKQVVIPDLVLIVEHEGKPVGFSLCVPDVNEVMPRNGRLFPLGWYKLLTGMKKTAYARLITLGVLPGYRKRGIESLLCIETALRSKNLGMKGGEISWTLEDNVLVNRAAEAMGASLDRKYRLFGMTV